MAQHSGSVNKQRGLRHAASVIFALVAIVPLLVFAYTLYALDALRHAQAQAALGLALAVSLLGYWLFRAMLGQMSTNVDALVKAVAQTNRAYASMDPAAAAPPGVTRAASRSAASAGRASASAFAHGGTEHHVAGLGAIHEFGEMARMMNQLWLREATRNRGHRVQVSVANATAPLVGVITEVTDDGFYIEEDGATVPVSYLRVQGIERLNGAS